MCSRKNKWTVLLRERWTASEVLEDYCQLVVVQCDRNCGERTDRSEVNPPFFAKHIAQYRIRILVDDDDDGFGAILPREFPHESPSPVEASRKGY